MTEPLITLRGVAKTFPVGDGWFGGRRTIQAVDGVDLSVRQRLAYSVSRARLVYELDGAERTLDETTQCQKALSTEAVAGEDRSYECEVFLAGKVFSFFGLTFTDYAGGFHRDQKTGFSR